MVIEDFGKLRHSLRTIDCITNRIRNRKKKEREVIKKTETEVPRKDIVSELGPIEEMPFTARTPSMPIHPIVHKIIQADQYNLSADSHLISDCSAIIATVLLSLNACK